MFLRLTARQLVEAVTANITGTAPKNILPASKTSLALGVTDMATSTMRSTARMTLPFALGCLLGIVCTAERRTQHKEEDQRQKEASCALCVPWWYDSLYMAERQVQTALLRVCMATLRCKQPFSEYAWQSLRCKQPFSGYAWQERLPFNGCLQSRICILPD